MRVTCPKCGSPNVQECGAGMWKCEERACHTTWVGDHGIHS